jgi:hypothetical protein
LTFLRIGYSFYVIYIYYFADCVACNTATSLSLSRSRQMHTKLGKMLEKPRDDVLGKEWLTLVNRYSRLDFTCESDRLMILEGIVARTHEHFKYEYVFGLWKSQLLLGLLWEKIHWKWYYFDGNECKAPSWSWVLRSDS